MCAEGEKVSLEDFEMSGRKADRKEIVRIWTEIVWFVTGCK
jgi:hypothetical protein